MSQNLVASIRYNLYTKSLNSVENEISNDKTQTTIVSDCEVIGSDFQNIYINGIASILTILIYLVILFLLSWKLTILILLFVPIFILVNFKLSLDSRKFFFSIQSMKDELLSQLSDTIQGFTFIKIYNLKKNYIAKFNTKNLKLKKSNIKYNTIITFIGSLVSFLATSAPFLILLSGSFYVIRGQMTLGNVIASFSYSTAFFAPVSKLIGLMPTTEQMSLSLQRVNETLALEFEKKTYVKEFKDRVEKSTSLQINNLGAGYKSSQIFSNFSYSFLIGKCYLITGPNASGKSTLAQTIAKLLPVKTGDIVVSKKMKVGYVPQNNYLFSESIINNLTIGLDSYNVELFNHLLQITGLENDLMRNRQSISTLVGNNNNSLSTGQIQKIKLIRALLDEPDILILDEIIANIDVSAQKRILEFLKKWSLQHTLILISHDSETIKNIINPEIISFPLSN